MRRRQFIGATVSMITAGGMLSATAGARAEGHLPNDRVPYTIIQPWADGDLVPTGDWVVHRIGWIDETRKGVERFLDLIDFEAWIDGEPVPNVDTYWRDIHQVEDGWLVWWKYATPPRRPGNHSFRTKFEFLGDYDEDWPEGSGIDLTGHYVVEPADRKP